MHLNLILDTKKKKSFFGQDIDTSFIYSKLFKAKIIGTEIKRYDTHFRNSKENASILTEWAYPDQMQADVRHASAPTKLGKMHIFSLLTGFLLIITFILTSH